jgi:kanamycin nucleotidyltransferase
LVPNLRKFTHEDRLRIAHQISDRILAKYGNDVLAVYVCGSTSKKLDRPFSDLELIVVVRDRAKVPMKYYLHRGLIIHIQYPTSSYTLDDAEQFTDSWHWVADQYRNRIVLFERDGWFRRLDEAVAKSDKRDSREAIRKSFMMMTESMAVLRNDMLTKDKVGVLMRGRVLAEDAARILLLMNRKYVTTTSWFWKVVFDLPNKPKNYKKLVEKMSGFVPTSMEEIVASSEMMYREVSDLLTRHGVKIERGDLWV